MANKITIEMRAWHGARYAIDHRVNEREIDLLRDPTMIVTLKVGLETITLTKRDLGNLLRAVQTAADTGASHPDDLKPFYDLEPKV